MNHSLSIPLIYSKNNDEKIKKNLSRGASSNLSVFIHSQWRYICHIRFTHGKATMEFPFLVLLLGVSFSQWTTVTSFRLGPCLLEIKDNLLKNVTLLTNTSDIKIVGIGFMGIIEGAFDTVTHIKTLDLSNNNIETLPPNVFSKLTNVEELSLAHNKLHSRQFNKTFVGLNSLERLNLSGNDMSFLDSNSFIGLPNSAEVIIEKGGFSEFNVIEYTILKRLIRRSVKFNEIPKTSKVQLCMVNGSVKSLSELKKNVKNPTGCVTGRIKRQKGVINFSKRGVTSFNRNWYKLAAYEIRKIDFSSNMIADITPELLNDLTVPLTIDLYDTGISRIKANVMKNKHCMGLYFGGKSLQEIEDHAFEELCLTELVIENSDLSNLDFIRTLPIMIEHLAVTENEIFEIPSGLFQHLNELKTVDLSFNKLKTIGGNVFSGLVNRLDIVLDHNEINYIAEGSFFNVNLYRLHLNYNEITDESIHQGAFNLSNIEIFELTHNSMKSFDEELFSGILEKCLIRLDANPITHIKNLNYRNKISQ